MKKTEIKINVSGTVKVWVANKREAANAVKQVKNWIRDTLNDEAGFIPVYNTDDGSVVEGSTERARYTVVAK